MKQIILTLAAVAASVTTVSGQGTGVLDRYYIDGLIYGKTSETTVSCAGAFDDGVEKVVIPETINADGSVFTVTSISEEAFAGCNFLSSITIPKTIESISESAFATGSSNISVYISDLAAWCKINFENEYANPLARYGSKLYVDGVLVTDLKIPDGITEIKPYSFYGLDSMTSLTLPNNVTTIGDSAFSGCSGLTSLSIPNSVTTIGNGAFSYCSGLTSLAIPNNVTTIGGSAYYGCSGLTSLTLSSSVTMIGDSAFSGCFGLTSLAIPNSVTTIGNSAFSYCSGLTSLAIPNSVTTIGNSAFSYCSGLTSLAIPNSVTTIGNSAFSYCSSLTSLSIPNSVITIESSAFFNCIGLEAVVIGRNVTTIGYEAFYSYESNITRVDILALTPPDYEDIYGMFNNTVYNDAVLSVPTGSLEAYRAADGWKWFKNIQEKDFGGVDGVEDDAVSIAVNGGSIEIAGADNARVEVYNLSGQLVYSGTETTVGGLSCGIYIVRVAGQIFKVAL